MQSCSIELWILQIRLFSKPWIYLAVEGFFQSFYLHNYDKIPIPRTAYSVIKLMKDAKRFNSQFKMASFSIAGSLSSFSNMSVEQRQRCIKH